MSRFLIILACFPCAFLAACGGGGSNGSSPVCGPTFRTPNYNTETDPGSSRQNRILTWPSFPVNYSIRNQVTLLQGASSSSDLVRQAAQAWIASTNGRMRLTEIPSNRSAEISVGFAQVAQQPGAGDTLGFTSVTFDPDTLTLFEATITVNVWPGMSEAQVRQGLLSTIQHEFGHALFLNGHSEDSGDLMFFQASPSLLKPITTRDLNSLETAYCGDFNGRATRVRPKNLVTVTINCRVPSEFKWTKA